MYVCGLYLSQIRLLNFFTYGADDAYLLRNTIPNQRFPRFFISLEISGSVLLRQKICKRSYFYRGSAGPLSMDVLCLLSVNELWEVSRYRRPVILLQWIGDISEVLCLSETCRWPSVILEKEILKIDSVHIMDILSWIAIVRKYRYLVRRFFKKYSQKIALIGLEVLE